MQDKITNDRYNRYFKKNHLLGNSSRWNGKLRPR